MWEVIHEFEASLEGGKEVGNNLKLVKPRKRFNKKDGLEPPHPSTLFLLPVSRRRAREQPFFLPRRMRRRRPRS